MTAMKAILLILLPVLVILSSGCATAGRPSLDPQALLMLTEQNTTQAELELMLGKPDDAVTGANGKTLTSYRDYDRDWRLMKGEVGIEFRSAFFLFSEEGVLEKKLISETGTTVVSKGSVATVGRPISEEQIAQLTIQKTRFEEVFNILGSPLVEMLTLEGDIIREWVFSREATFSKSGSQTLTAFFDYDTDVLQNFIIRDDLPADKKKVATE